MEEEESRFGSGGGAADTENLAACVRILDAVARGSDAHVELSLEYATRAAQRFGEGHEEATQAGAACEAAHVARYGRTSLRLLSTLMRARAEASEEGSDE